MTPPKPTCSACNKLPALLDEWEARAKGLRESGAIYYLGMARAYELAAEGLIQAMGRALQEGKAAE